MASVVITGASRGIDAATASACAAAGWDVALDFVQAAQEAAATDVSGPLVDVSGGR